MIERFYLKEFVSFRTAEIEFNPGLIVFSGPSGSGKSLLMQAILSSFGLTSSEAYIAESSVNWQIDSDFGIENEEINIFKQIKKEKTRYFINAQSVAKKTIQTIAKRFIRYLSLKDYSDFENKNLLALLDKIILSHEKEYHKLQNSFLQTYKEFFNVKKELEQLQEEEKKIDDLKEFTLFEIEKISMVSPKIGEYEELLEIKKELSKKEKVQEAIQKAYNIFEYEHYVNDVFDLAEEDSDFFTEVMNELRCKLETISEKFQALEEIDVESVLDRLEALHELTRKYGSIEESLNYLENKRKELEKYENISFEKEKLEQKYKTLQTQLEQITMKITNFRQQYLPIMQEQLQAIIKQLYLQKCIVKLFPKNLDNTGKDKVVIELQGVDLEKISTGEFNRLRLAILTLKAKYFQNNKGILILDEIDANLSGEESMSVAKILKKLSKNYQIFVISHQPQLTSFGDQHFLVYKENNISYVKELQKQERINEIARIISGENISKEAINFATELLASKNIK